MCCDAYKTLLISVADAFLYDNMVELVKPNSVRQTRNSSSTMVC
jgi:hypothetical protein